MASIFDQISQSLANVLGTDVILAGFIMGFITIFAIFITLIWMGLAEEMESSGMLVIGGICIVFVVLIGWWPAWSIVFIGLFLGIVIVMKFDLV